MGGTEKPGKWGGRGGVTQAWGQYRDALFCLLLLEGRGWLGDGIDGGETVHEYRHESG